MMTSLTQCKHFSISSCTRDAVNQCLIRFLISVLGEVGDVTSIPAPQSIADDFEFEKDAIEAIKSIQRAQANGITSEVP